MSVNWKTLTKVPVFDYREVWEWKASKRYAEILAAEQLKLNENKKPLPYPKIKEEADK